jgi:hypothetical protein
MKIEMNKIGIRLDDLPIKSPSDKGFRGVFGVLGIPYVIPETTFGSGTIAFPDLAKDNHPDVETRGIASLPIPRHS